MKTVQDGIARVLKTIFRSREFAGLFGILYLQLITVKMGRNYKLILHRFPAYSGNVFPTDFNIIYCLDAFVQILPSTHVLQIFIYNLT